MKMFIFLCLISIISGLNCTCPINAKGTFIYCYPNGDKFECEGPAIPFTGTKENCKKYCKDLSCIFVNKSYNFYYTQSNFWNPAYCSCTGYACCNYLISHSFLEECENGFESYYCDYI